MSGAPQPAAGFPAGLHKVLGDLYAASSAVKYGVSLGDFTRILTEVLEKYLPGSQDLEAMRELLATLHAEELVLARGCAAGDEKAWEVFLTRYREKLYDAARAIARDDSMGRELADSLYADLYASSVRDGERVSKLKSYMGRGSLEGWLRTVLSQAFIDRYRSRKRLVSLEEKEEEDGEQFAAPAPEAVVAADPRLESATTEALSQLTAEERFILAAYFLDGRTLAEVARMLSVHESTISRRVEKITAGLRKHIRDGMVRRGMSKRQADEALEADVRDVQVNVRAHLAQESRPRSFPDQEAGAPAASEES